MYLPIGFVTDSEILDYSAGSSNLFENQNELFKKATGIDEDVYTSIEVKDVGHQGVTVSKESYGSYRYQIDNSYPEDETRYFKYNFEIPEDGPIYVIFDFDNVSTLQVKLKNTDTDEEDTVLHTFSLGKYINTFPAGDFNAGDIVTLYSSLTEEASGTGKIYVYQINSDVLRRGYEKLSAGGLNVSEYTDTSITGTVEAAQDGVFYTSIPYDGGWKVYIDGEETEVTPLKNALVCVPISEGTHTVEMKYSPPGYKAGLAVSVGSIAVFILVIFIEKKMKKKSAALSAENSDSENNEG
jgi:uncharacterized membrane protein YfhO